MEFDEEQELAFLNAITRRNRYDLREKTSDPAGSPAPSGAVWIAGTLLMILLAHLGAIPGWLMHLTTELLTFRFAFGLGRFYRNERRMNHV